MRKTNTSFSQHAVLVLANSFFYEHWMIYRNCSIIVKTQERQLSTTAAIKFLKYRQNAFMFIFMFMACQMDVIHAFYNSSQAEHDEDFANDVIRSLPRVQSF